MALTTEDIQEKTFGTRFRGYNPEEVDVFLEDIMEEFDRLEKELAQGQQQTKELEDRLNYFDEVKESLSQSVLVAQETADRVRKQAEEEAAQTLVTAKDEADRLMKQAQEDSQRIVADAQNEAQSILDRASGNAQELLSETEDLRKQSQTFQERMVSALQEQLRLAQSSEWEELLHPVSPNSVLAQVLGQPSESAPIEVAPVVEEASGIPVVEETPQVESQEQEFVFDAPEVSPEEVASEESSENYDEQEVFDATRQFTEEEMMDLQRRIDESNRILEETQNLQADIEEAQRILEEQGLLDEETTEVSQDVAEDDSLDETKTFKLF